MDDIKIPDEVVEAFYGTPLHGIIPEILAKALAAWPGADVQLGAQVTKKWRDPGKIILPLPVEKSNG